MEEVLSAIKQLRVGKVYDEYELQAAIADVFDKHKIAYSAPWWDFRNCGE